MACVDSHLCTDHSCAILVSAEGIRAGFPEIQCGRCSHQARIQIQQSRAFLDLSFGLVCPQKITLIAQWGRVAFAGLVKPKAFSSKHHLISKQLGGNPPSIAHVLGPVLYN